MLHACVMDPESLPSKRRASMNERERKELKRKLTSDPSLNSDASQIFSYTNYAQRIWLIPWKSSRITWLWYELIWKFMTSMKVTKTGMDPLSVPENIKSESSPTTTEETPFQLVSRHRRILFLVLARVAHFQLRVSSFIYTYLQTNQHQIRFLIYPIPTAQELPPRRNFLAI